MGTTTAQKNLFFNLKKLKNQIAPGQDGDLRDEQVNEISKRLDVDSNEVVNMNRRMMGQEKSLNDPIKSGETDEWQDWLVDDSLDQELVISQKQEYDDKKELLESAMKILNEREKEKRCGPSSTFLSPISSTGCAAATAAGHRPSATRRE